MEFTMKLKMELRTIFDGCKSWTISGKYMFQFVKISRSNYINKLWYCDMYEIIMNYYIFMKYNNKHGNLTYKTCIELGEKCSFYCPNWSSIK